MYLRVLAVFRPVVTAITGAESTASTRSSTKILSICAVYWKYSVYFDHLSVHRRFDNFIRILLQTAFTIHGWSYEWELKQSTFGGELEYLRVLAVFREYMLRALEISTGSTLLDTLSTAHISDVCTAGTACCTRSSVLLVILPVLAVFGPSVLVRLILPVRSVFRTPHTRVLQYSQQQQYPEYRTPQYCQHKQHQKKSIGHHTYEHTVRRSSMMHRHAYLQ